MKITVAKEQLLEKLADIQSIVEKKTTMQILSHFLLQVAKDKSEIAATDLETAIKEPLVVEKVEEEGSICIPARKLFEIVREVEGLVSLSTDDGEWVRIKAGASNFRLACLSAEDFPRWPAWEEGEKISLKASILRSVIEKTLYSAGESDTRYTLNGLLFHIKPAEGRFIVVGTDGHRLAAVHNALDQGTSNELKVIVPRKAASEIRKFLGDGDIEVQLAIGKNHVQFEVGDVKFLTRLIEGSYPNYEQVLPLSNEKKVLVEKDIFVKALRRVSVMSRERSNAVKVDFKSGLITVTASNPDLGEARDEISAQYEGEDVSLGFNARYLLDTLSAIESDNASIALHDPMSPALLKEEDSEEYLCVIMPMRT